MKSRFFAYLFRMKNIQRWSLMRSLVPENILEHSIEVAMVAHMLGALRNRRFGGDVDLNRLVTLAMYHDCGEVVTSDLPTPIKYLTPELKASFKEVEELVSLRYYSMIPEDLREDFEWIFMPDEGDGQLYELLKAADTVCAYFKCVDEESLGNHDFENAKQTLSRALEKLKVPEIEVFFDVFGRDLSIPLESIS